MEIRAKYDGAVRDMRSGDIKITIVTDHMPVGLEEMQGDLRISLKPWKEKRSLDANAMLWACIGQLAEALHKDRESVYADLLKSYGQCEYILAKPKTIPALKAAFRVVEEISSGEIGGEPAVQVACYIGSSAYDTAQFSCGRGRTWGLSLLLPEI